MNKIFEQLRRVLALYKSRGLVWLIEYSLRYLTGKYYVRVALLRERILSYGGVGRRRTLFVPDVYLISYPKAGRTWIRVILAKILKENGGNPERLELIRYKHFGIGGEYLEDVDIKTSWKIRNMWKNNRVILLVRDPRDIVVSFYFQVTKRAAYAYGYKGSISNFIRDGKYGIRRTIRFYNDWYGFRHVPKDFMVVKYEDLKKNPEREIVRMCEFLGIRQEVSDSTVKKAIKYASFEKMRRMEVTKRHLLSNTGALEVVNPDDPESYKTRKGVVGGYVSYMSKADIKYVDREMKKLNHNFGYLV